MSGVNVPLALPEIGQEEKDAVLSVLESNWLTHGQFNIDFERNFAEYIGVKYAIAMNSCTSALEIALKANNIHGEVVVPSFTFVASANAIVLAGATPVFCDADIMTRNTTEDYIKECLTNKTEAVMVVHYGGQPCPMTEIAKLCEERGFLLIEDSAETLGATWEKKQAGSFGIGCFSFFPTKNITTGEGGMFTCDDEGIANTAKALIGHGISSSTFAREKAEKSWYRAAIIPGHNYRMSNILAAIGYHQLKKVDDMNNRRRALAEHYSYEIVKRGLPIDPPVTSEGATHVFQMYTVLASPEKRGHWVRVMRENGVGASVHFDPPVHEMEYYAQNYPTRHPLKNTEVLSKGLITLPLYQTMQHSDIDSVLNVMEKVMI